MSWFGYWFGRWFGSWFGSLDEATVARRFGRILKAGDLLFADEEAPCAISSGAVILARQSSDDYVRFRVPDTNCPALPEPSLPLDDGQADVAEPVRWLYGGDYVSGTGWKFRGHPTTGSGFTYVQPAYICYDGDFSVELQFRITISGYVPKAMAADTNWFVFGLPELGCGIAVGGGISWYGDVGRTTVVAWQNGNPGASLNTINEDTTYTLRITRTNGTIVVALVGGNSQQVATGSTGRVQLKLWRDFRTYDPPFVHLPPVTALSISTASGAPSSVTVSTPVIDLGRSTKAVVRRYPEIGTLEWRASDQEFGQYDGSPAWDSPTGNYRYWQLRVTWTDASQLLERIELSADAQRLITFRRFRDTWTIWDTSQGKSVPTDDDAIFGSGTQERTDEGWQHDSDEERVVTIE